MKEGRKGFTLIELLIVIVVIGILSAMMMISISEMTATAQVTKILSDMKNIRFIAIQWYMDNTDKITDKYALKINGKTEDIQTYMSGYGNTKYSNQDSLRAYLEASGAKRINTGNPTGGYGTVNPGDYALINGKHIAGQGDVDNANKVWYISYRAAKDNTNMNKRQREKLAKKAKEAGLIGKDGKTYKGQEVAFLEVIRFAD